MFMSQQDLKTRKILKLYICVSLNSQNRIEEMK